MSIPFVIEYVYDAPIEKVWHALTDKNKMKEWYFPALQKFEPVAGFEFEFINDSSPQKEWKVTEIMEGQKFAHSWSYKGYPGTSEVSFKLFEKTGKTRLRLTHTGLESFPDDPHFARKRFENGWKQIPGHNLKDLLKK